MRGRVVAFDLGEKRIGVAVSDPTGTIAEGRDTIVQGGSSVPWKHVLAVVEEAEAVCVVVGDPVKLDGSLGEGSKRIEGVGRSGNEFVHYIGPAVDASGRLHEGAEFADIIEFKKLLLQDKEVIARNLVQQLVVYATGAPVGFADRDEVEAILEQTEGSEYGARSIIHAIVQSPLFLRK